MIDVKRLVTIFLIFAASVSSFAIGASFFSSTSVQPQSATITASKTGIPSNAFTPTSAAESGIENQIALDSDTASDNLTNNLADMLTQNLVSQNPNGPILDPNGGISLVSPKPEIFVGDLASSSAVQNFKAPDWDAEIAALPINIVSNSNDAAKAAYGKAFTALENKYFIQTDLSGLLNKDGAGDSSETTIFAIQQLNSAIQEATALAVPESLVSFHKSFVKLLVYERNALQNLQTAGTDPFRAELVMQSKERAYNDAEAAFEHELPNAQAFLQSAANSPEEKNAVAEVFNTLLGIQKAHAQFFGGVVFDPAVFGRLVFDFIQSVLLQILKNQVIALLQNKVLGMIRNSGNPKFVQNWTTFLGNAFDSAAGSAIGQIIPGLCPNFSTPLSTWLQSDYPIAKVTQGGISLNGSFGTTCTLQGIVNNPQAYYQNFSQGGFAGLGALMQPNNNIFGALITANDSIMAVADQSQNSAQNKAVSANGYVGAEICGDGSTPPPGGTDCLDGDPIITAPGKSFSDTLSRNLNSDIDLIVNANDITGLLATVAGALLQQVIQSGANGLLGATGSNVVQPAPPPPLPVTCSPKTQTVAVGAQATLAATGGANNGTFNWSAPGANPAAGTGAVFSPSYAIAGTYNVGLIISTGGFNNCTVVVQ